MLQTLQEIEMNDALTNEKQFYGKVLDKFTMRYENSLFGFLITQQIFYKLQVFALFAPKTNLPHIIQLIEQLMENKFIKHALIFDQIFFKKESCFQKMSEMKKNIDQFQVPLISNIFKSRSTKLLNNIYEYAAFKINDEILEQAINIEQVKFISREKQGKLILKDLIIPHFKINSTIIEIIAFECQSILFEIKKWKFIAREIFVLFQKEKFLEEESEKEQKESYYECYPMIKLLYLEWYINSDKPEHLYTLIPSDLSKPLLQFSNQQLLVMQNIISSLTSFESIFDYIKENQFSLQEFSIFSQQYNNLPIRITQALQMRFRDCDFQLQEEVLPNKEKIINEQNFDPKAYLCLIKNSQDNWIIVSKKKQLKDLNEIFNGFKNLKISEVIQDENLFMSQFVQKIYHQVNQNTDGTQLQEKFKIGSILSVKRMGRLYYHSGIYMGADLIFHINLPKQIKDNQLILKNKSEVQEKIGFNKNILFNPSPFSEFIEEQEEIIEYRFDFQLLEKNELYERALLMNQIKINYDLLANNCDQVAFEIVTGYATSPQLKSFPRYVFAHLGKLMKIKNCSLFSS